MPLALDLNSFVDVLVPVYTAVVVLVLYLFNKSSSGQNTKKIYTFEPESSSEGRIYSLSDFVGTWKQESAPALDDWLTFLGKNYAVRIIASSMFFKQRATFTFNEDFTKLTILRDYGKGNMPFTVADVPISDNIETATTVAVPAEEGGWTNTAQASFDKETGTLVVKVVEDVKKGISATQTTFTRVINPKNRNILNSTWDCAFLDPKRVPNKMKMVVQSCRVEYDS